MIKKLCDNIVPYIDRYVITEDRGAPWLDNRNNYEWYYSYGKIFRPKKILEIGTRCGYSLLSMMFGAEDSVRDVCFYDSERDIEGSIGIATDNLTKAFPEVNIESYKIDTNLIETPLHSDRNFDIIHIDADHNPDSVRHDFKLFWDSLAPGGVLILDDMKSISGENNTYLFHHILPWILDDKYILSFEYIKNYNRQLLVYKNE
jgi:predicted O-methyltransferase YrrM